MIKINTYNNPAVTYAADKHQGRLFWITCKRLKQLRKASCLQVIQNLAPSVVRHCQCDIEILGQQKSKQNKTVFVSLSPAENWFLICKLPLLTPLVSLRTVHSSMVPKEVNITRTSLSLYFLDTIPMNNFRSEKWKKKSELTKVHLKNREVMVPSGWSILSNRNHTA